MSKESLLALPCPGCNAKTTFLKYHAPSCPNPFKSAVIRKLAASLSKNPPVNKEF